MPHTRSEWRCGHESRAEQPSSTLAHTSSADATPSPLRVRRAPSCRKRAKNARGRGDGARRCDVLKSRSRRDRAEIAPRTWSHRSRRCTSAFPPSAGCRFPCGRTIRRSSRLADLRHVRSLTHRRRSSSRRDLRTGQVARLALAHVALELRGTERREHPAHEARGLVGAVC